MTIREFAARNLNPVLGLRQAIESHKTLERALAWFFAQTPALVPEDLIAQDEFSYDLLVPCPGGLYFSYDTC